MIRVEIDIEARAAYIRLRDDLDIVRTMALRSNVSLDLGPDGEVLGIEVLDLT
jgi:uncharacterized protein YuzE